MYKNKIPVLDKIKRIVGGFEEDDKKIFEVISNLSPDFDVYANNFYLDFKNSIKKLEEYSLYTLTAFSELERLLKNKDRYEIENLSLNAIVLIYGYAMLFNQALDSGIISKGISTEIERYANNKKISESDVLLILDENSPASLEVKRYNKGGEILHNPEIRKEIEKLKGFNLFDDSDMEGLENKLYAEIKDGYLINSEQFNIFFKLFKEIEYFPILNAVRILVQIMDYPSPKASIQGKPAKLDDELKPLADMYAKAKMYKDITGIENKNKVFMLYFDVLKEIANKKQINSYSPIRSFVEQLEDHYENFVKLYDLNDKSRAYEKLKKWYSILEDR
jgi:hypothetical protein